MLLIKKLGSLVIGWINTNSNLLFEKRIDVKASILFQVAKNIDKLVATN